MDSWGWGYQKRHSDKASLGWRGKNMTKIHYIKATVQEEKPTRYNQLYFNR